MTKIWHVIYCRRLCWSFLSLVQGKIILIPTSRGLTAGSILDLIVCKKIALHIDLWIPRSSPERSTRIYYATYCALCAVSSTMVHVNQTILYLNKHFMDTTHKAWYVGSYLKTSTYIQISCGTLRVKPRDVDAFFVLQLVRWRQYQAWDAFALCKSLLTTGRRWSILIVLRNNSVGILRERC